MLSWGELKASAISAMEEKMHLIKVASKTSTDQLSFII